MFFTQKKIITVALEATYGVDATPVLPAEAVLARNLTITPLEQDELERPIVQQGFGSFASIVAGQRATVTFDIELAGSGAAGTAPAWGLLMQACGMAETVVAATSVSYDPISTVGNSVTMYINRDGILHPITGARGDVSLKYTANGEALLSFSFIGLFGQPTAVAPVTPDFTAFRKPLSVGAVNTPTFTLFGSSFIMSACELKHGNNVQYRNLVNYEGVDILGRTATATATIDEPPLATFDFFAQAQTKTTGAMQIVHGTAAGNIVTVDAPAVEMAKPALSDLNGVAGMDLTMKLLPLSAGDGDFSYTLT